jgi:hypothetical protein
MTPNIFIYHKDKEYVFHRQNWIDEVNISDYTRKFIVKKLDLKYYEALVVLTSGYIDTDVDKLVQFVSEKDIRKIYFFVEDTLRLYNEYEGYTGDNHIMYTDPYKTRAYEFDIITEILERTRVDYKIYHCEDNSKIFEEIYGFKIEYFDWFAADQSKYDFVTVFDVIIPQEDRHTWHGFTNRFDYKVCSLNLRATMPRLYMASLLCQDINAFVTWHQPPNKTSINNNMFNFDLFRDDIRTKIANGLKLLEDKRSFRQEENSYSRTKGEIEGLNQYKTISEIRNSFVQIVSESKFVSPMPNFSEKTLKSILSWRPFILLAPPKTLKLLKDLGFKTFNKWWDESYDDIDDPYKRFETVHDLAQWILQQDKDTLSQMLEEMKDTVNYNKVKLFVLKESMWQYHLDNNLHVS